MNGGRVSICCFTGGVPEYPGDRALVAVDVIRATTTAVTAISMGRECYVVPTLQAAFDTASRLPNALLGGEVGGAMPAFLVSGYFFISACFRRTLRVMWQVPGHA